MKPKERFLNYALLSSTTTTTATTHQCDSNSHRISSRSDSSPPPPSLPYKEDIPIDLSVKKPSLVSIGSDQHQHRRHHQHHLGPQAHFGLYKGDHHHPDRILSSPAFLHQSPPSPSHIGEWLPPAAAAAARYCLPPASNFADKVPNHYHHGDHYHHSSSIFPYLFIGNAATAGCLPPLPAGPVGPGPVSDLDAKKMAAVAAAAAQRDHHLHQHQHHQDSALMEHYVMPYRLAQDGILFPFKIDGHFGQFHHSHHHPHVHHPHHHGRHSEPHLPLSVESTSSSSSSSPYEFHIPDYGGGDAKYKPSSTSAQRTRQKSPPSSSISSSSSSSNGNGGSGGGHQPTWNATKRHGSHHTTATATGKYGGDPKVVPMLKRAWSQSCLPTATIKDQIRQNIYRRSLYRSKSECNLHLIIKSYCVSSTTTTMSPTFSSPSSSASAASTPTNKFCAPKKMFASNYQKEKEITNNGTKEETEEMSLGEPPERRDDRKNNAATKFSYRNYRKEVIECWDNERRDNESSSTMAAAAAATNHQTAIKTANGNNVLDLRTNGKHPPPTVMLSHHQRELNEFRPRSSPVMLKFGTDPSCLPSPVASSKQLPPAAAMTHPLDLYKQYYYYLMQEPAFASRAAVAVAETYAKILSHGTDSPEMEKSPTITPSSAAATVVSNGGGALQKSPPMEKLSPLSSPTSSSYETKRTSPDCSQDGLAARTELRSADTTNGNLLFDRKRISRPLTGKHVRHGTGASPSTLVSLRNMIQQRQKLKEIGKFDCHARAAKGKMANKRIKRK